MLFQFSGDPIILILGIIIGTIIVSLILYLIVRIIESEHRANDKIYMIILEAFIAVFVLPIILGAISMVLSAIGSIPEGARNLIDNGGANYLVQLVPIFGFLILLALSKFLIDISWESALWISLLLLFVVYIIYSVVPELYTVLQIQWWFKKKSIGIFLFFFLFISMLNLFLQFQPWS